MTFDPVPVTVGEWYYYLEQFRDDPQASKKVAHFDEKLRNEILRKRSTENLSLVLLAIKFSTTEKEALIKALEGLQGKLAEIIRTHLQSSEDSV